jgi:hypothetical protein
MTEIDEGYFFWKRVDATRPKTKTLKQLVEEAGLNYHLVKVQRSCNRIPKAMEAAKLAKVLDLSLEWLLTGKICEIPVTDAEIIDSRKRHQITKIVNLLWNADQSKWKSVETVLSSGIGSD